MVDETYIRNHAREKATSRSESPLIPSLNGIRAISVLIVLASHVGFGNIVPGGLGVTIFFFLSGFLITSLFLVEVENFGQIDIPKFYLRRAFRLIPPLIITLLISYNLVFLGLLSGSITIRGFLSQILYFSNYYCIFVDPSGSTVPAGTGILWSLAVEEHFYVLYPIMIGLLLKYVRNRAHVVLLFVSLCLLTLAWRLFLVLNGASEIRTYYASDTRIDSIVFGCILAIGITSGPMHHKIATLRSYRLDPMSLNQWFIFALALGFLVSTIVYRDSIFRETLRYTIQGITLIPIFYFALRFPSSPPFSCLNSSWLNKLGIYSYFIYLIHFVIVNYFTQLQLPIFSQPFVLTLIVLFLSILYAALIDNFVDPYFRDLRRRLHQNEL